MSELDAHTLTQVESKDFIRELIERDRASGKHQGRVVTRFPPEPNGYLHIGHSKSICLNFGLAEEYGGRCHLRFDDTNPAAEDLEYVESIQRDVRWLGFDWGEHLYFASDYYERLYQIAERLIRSGDAYVCSLSEAEIREYRGTISEPGRPSPYRDRTVEENLDLFRRMKAGEFADGAHVLRAKIDMAAPNMKLRDPLIYRIRHHAHYRLGDAWCIYPLYDFAHCLSDGIEGVTHSLCTLEFENNRPLYDWFLARSGLSFEGAAPEQTEFARLGLSYTVMSKRKLLRLVQEKHVSGWDDPRMPTIAGLRRRGYTPEAIRNFARRVGVAKNNSLVDFALLEHAVREDLSQRSPRVLCVLQPLKLTITNYPAEKVEELTAPYFPPDVGKPGSRALPFSRELWIEQEDFELTPPKGFRRLSPGASVRLRYAHVITCESVVKDADGNVVEVQARLASPEEAERLEVKGTIHWVSAAHAVSCTVHCYDRLFQVPEPDAGEDVDFLSYLNPQSLETFTGCQLEPAAAREGLTQVQFERHGYFCLDRAWGEEPEAASGELVWNRTVPLKDSWARVSRGAMEAEPPRRRAGQANVRNEGSAQAPSKAASPGAAALALQALHGLTEQEARVISAEPRLGKLLVQLEGLGTSPKLAARWLANDVAALTKVEAGELKFGAAELASLIQLVESGTLTRRLAKDVFAELAQSGEAPEQIVERLGGQLSGDEELIPVVDQVLAKNPEHVSRYRAGNLNLMGAFVGQVMRATGGRANPQRVTELLEQRLKAD
ncbi:MAG: glutamine--tRNA ligase/YqeY domain fusion protein [Polyangiaceae bacterium]|nr:glutamine--tRNA ligase/YqeY domain fusion protein [Polyangiaceae bacterium]MCW5789358.1 glutamine--tRNA ligase/YqeY domain fusion protein [Polyangiaceae bacterium]